METQSKHPWTIHPALLKSVEPWPTLKGTLDFIAFWRRLGRNRMRADRLDAGSPRAWRYVNRSSLREGYWDSSRPGNGTAHRTREVM